MNSNMFNFFFIRVDKPSTELLPKKSKLVSNPPVEHEANSGASTSGTGKNDNRPREEPVSEFYQSLLESSYTDDGSEFMLKCWQ